jgi:hypothetical protein
MAVKAVNERKWRNGENEIMVSMAKIGIIAKI